jgi:hypothetical protein
MDVTVEKVKENADLYHQYSQQSSPQDVFVELECDSGILRADWNAEIGNATPFSVYYGRDQRWGIPPLKAKSANNLLESIAPIAQRVLAGYDTRWDGNNMVGDFNEDAQDALNEIAAICEETCDPSLNDGEVIQVYDADDWFQYCQDDELIKQYGITAKTTDDELVDIEKKIREEEIDKYDLDELNDVDDFLERLREIAIDAEEEDENE